MARCPTCKEPVSQFAAGCAVCGTDLEDHRRQATTGRRLPAAPSLPRLPGVPDALLTVVFVAVVVLAFPLFGLLLVGLVLHRERMTSQGPMRAALFALAGAGLVFLLSPETRYGVWTFFG